VSPIQTAGRRSIEPMLAGTASEVPAGSAWTFEPKYDGMRVIADVTRDLHGHMHNARAIFSARFGGAPRPAAQPVEG